MSVLASLTYGIIISLIDSLRLVWLNKQLSQIKTSPFWISVINVFAVTLILILSGLLIYDWYTSLLFGIVFGVIFGLHGSKRNLQDDIRTTEALYWNWRQALKGWLVFGLFGLFLGVFDGLTIKGLMNSIILLYHS